MVDEENLDEDEITIREDLDEQSYKEGFFMWLAEFHKKYLDFDTENNQEYKITDIQKELFIVQNDALFIKLAPDIGGHMTKRTLDSERMLGHMKTG